MNAPGTLSSLDADSSSEAGDDLGQHLLGYYQAIEQASINMLEAARNGDWDTVIKLEGACAVLIAQLKHAASVHDMGPEEAHLKTRIMQRILINDAQIRDLAEPWLGELGHSTGPDSGFLH